MSTEVDRLEVVFTANIKAMEERLLKAVAANKKAAKDIENAWTGKGIFAAAEKGIDSFAEHVGEAARSIPGFGAALGALGPVGLTAAAGIGAFALAMEKTEKAVDYAAGIGKLAETVGVSTDFIQKFNFAARQSEVDVGAADAALKELNASVGAVQGNLPRAKQLAVVFADALKITPEQLRSYHDLESLFPLIAQRISEAGSAAEKAAIAKKLGIVDLLPMLDKGAAGFQKMSDEAESLGIIIQAAVIEKAQGAEAKLKALDDVMKAQSASTFVEYADTLVSIKTKFNEAAEAALHFLAAITGTRSATQELKDVDETIKNLQHPRDIYTAIIAGLSPSALKEAQARRAQLGGQILTDAAAEDAKARAKAGEGKPVSIVPPKPPKAGPKDETVDLTKAAMDVFATSMKGLETAQAALTDSLTERNVLEKLAIDSELAKQNVDIDAQIAKAKEAQKKGLDKEADNQVMQLEVARLNDEQIAIDKKLLLDKQLQEQHLQVQLAHEQAVADLQASAITAQANHLTALAGLTTHTQERIALERQAMLAQQAADRLLADTKIKQAEQLLADMKTKTADPDTLKPFIDALIAAQAARTKLDISQPDTVNAFNFANADPLAKYAEGIKTVDEQMSDWAVGGLNDLAQGFAQAVVEGGKLTDVAKSIFQKIAEDMIQSFVEQNVTKPAASFLSALFTPHAAGDLTGAAGGLALVGEKGPELVNLPGGSRVFSNSQLRQVGIGGGGAAQQTILFDNRGAVIWEQAARAMMAYADRSAATAGIGAVQATRQVIPAEIARASARSLR
jgi:hypothetical protein